MKLFTFKSPYATYECRIVKKNYTTGGLALCLEDREGPVATVTVSLPGPKLPDGHVFIKDYSENEGMLDSLKNAGLVKSIKGYTPSGHVTIPLVELDMEKLKEYVS